MIPTTGESASLLFCAASSASSSERVASGRGPAESTAGTTGAGAGWLQADDRAAALAKARVGSSVRKLGIISAFVVELLVLGTALRGVMHNPFRKPASPFQWRCAAVPAGPWSSIWTTRHWSKCVPDTAFGAVR